MGLTQLQKSLLEKAKAAGGGELGISLDEETCAFLLATIVRDLRLQKKFPELPSDCPAFFSKAHPQALRIENIVFHPLLERLIELVPDADTYFSCLATLHKSRLKYMKILEHQPKPTMDQIGPRSLLQYGFMSPKALAGFLLWRKWIFDIDNRAGQETGYLFEPIIAHAIGGFPVSARRSPVRRAKDKSKGRQIDCIRNKRAYEIKLRVTIAASGQGRWQEELDFPRDCIKSGYKPILIVLDPTPNPKLEELITAFERQNGETYIGERAWSHLEKAAGETMSIFLENYVRMPIQEVLSSCTDNLPNISFTMNDTNFIVTVDNE